MESDPFSPHAEAIRRLRTNLMFVNDTTRKHSFLITSPMSSEGKTTTAVNLAMVMAAVGTKVMLVDADLRNLLPAGEIPPNPASCSARTPCATCSLSCRSASTSCWSTPRRCCR